MVTLPPSSITGTARRPPESWSISGILESSFRTLTYSTSYPRFANASRAAVVYGQVSFPKIRTLAM
jgi:hypothetical protein